MAPTAGTISGIKRGKPWGNINAQPIRKPARRLRRKAGNSASFFTELPGSPCIGIGGSGW